MEVCSFTGFPGGSVVKNLPVNAGDVGSIAGWGRSPGRGNGCQDNPMDRGAWQATVHGIAQSWDTTEHSCKLLKNINPYFAASYLNMYVEKHEFCSNTFIFQFNFTGFLLASPFLICKFFLLR